MKTVLGVLVVLAGGAFVAGLGDDAVGAALEVSAPGKVEAVTLYRGQALVTRVVPFAGKAGPVELTITDLPAAVQGESLFASGGKDVQVRAVRYRTRALSEAPQAEVRKLDDQIAAVEKQTRENSQMQQLVAEQRSYLSRLEAFAAPTAQVEMTKGVLNADTLAKVTDLVFEKRAKAAQESLKLSEDARDLQKKIELLGRQRAELAQSLSKTQREALVFLDKTADGPGELRLSYLVSNASWSPTYNFRAGADLKTVGVEFGALAQQTSGEDWDSVELTLSTASARMVADGPVLSPMRLSLTSTAPGYEQITGGLRTAQTRLKSAGEVQNFKSGYEYQASAQWDMNVAAIQGQQAELAANESDAASVRDIMRSRGSALSANYKLGGKVSLASRRDNQMVQIVTLDLPAEFHYEAAPLLTEYVYRYAEVTNNSTLSLLEGRASAYVGGEFVGQSQIPLVASGQKVTVGFGVDPQLRVGREFVKKDERGQMFGGNKEVTYRYRLVLENYGDAAATVRLFDRIPVQTDEIKVSLGSLKDKLSTDAQYLRALRSQGILRWDIEVPAKAARATARIVEYSFVLEFDRNKYIGVEEPGQGQPAAQMKKQFQEVFSVRNSAQ